MNTRTQAATPSLIETHSLFDVDDEPLAKSTQTVRVADLLGANEVMSEALADAILAKWRHDATLIGRTPSDLRHDNTQKTILSLFDESGVWSAPYVLAGYNVIQVDIQNGIDALDLDIEYFADHGIDDIYGVLAACPCTHFANSGARWFADKDANGITQEGIDLVYRTLQIIDFFQPEFWVIENPIGRIQELCGLPDPRLIFQPHHFGDPYTKKTQLFGEFNAALPTTNVHPRLGSKMHQLWGANAADKKARSMTPEGFAFAFQRANP